MKLLAHNGEDNTEQLLLLTKHRSSMYRKVKLNIPNLHHEFSIDTLGIVRNETKGTVIKGTSITRNNRYVKVHLDKFYALHRLVAEHFILNPENLPQVNHINGDRYDNRVENLEWCSPSENVKHAYKTGLKTNHGTSNPVSKLTEEDVIRIWALRHTNMTARSIRDHLKLHVSVDAVKAVKQGKNWRTVTSQLE